MNETDQQVYVNGLALRDASRSPEGQLYHQHVKKLLDAHVDQLLALGLDEPDSKLVAIVRQLQGTYRCLEQEGDAVQKGYQVGTRLMEKARVGVR